MTGIRSGSAHRLLQVVLLLGLLAGFSSCKEENRRHPLENDGIPPAPISEVQVENLPGAARIAYSLPADEDLLYVQADYEIRPGVKQETKASFFDNALVVRGFGDTNPHEVQLYAVDRGGNKSDVVTATVHPLLPPVQAVYDSLDYYEDFGGISVSFVNGAQADIVVNVIVRDPSGEWVDYDRDYTSQASGLFTVRGLESRPTEFGVYVRDRWSNMSDTLIKTLTPLFEQELDKALFKPLVLPTDAASTWPLADLWNNNTVQLSGFHSNGNEGFPESFTMDLGVKAKLSRFRTWQVHDGREYSSGNIKQFELWGSNAPASDGSWDSWTLLGEFEIVKPSGMAVGQLSNEDIATAAAGDESLVPIAAPAVRYLRFKVISTFASPPNSSTGSAWLIELGFWGQVQP